MDVFKLAFETTIVGLLTFLWLGLAAYFLFPDLLNSLLAWIGSNTFTQNKTAIGVGALTVAYCLGSATLPIASQLVNDEHWPLNEDAIRCQVFIAQEDNQKDIYEKSLSEYKGLWLKDLPLPDHCSYWAPVFHPKPTERNDTWIWRLLVRGFHWPRAANDIQKEEEKKRTRILTLFQQQEAAVQNVVPQNSENLKQLHERIVVLRGCVFSLFILCLMSVCAIFARVNGNSSNWIKTAFGILLALSFAAFAVLNGIQDLMNQDIFDIPVLETLLAVVSFLGVVVVIRGIKAKDVPLKRYALLALFFAALTYGGWMWSEILYDQQVISSYAALKSGAKAVTGN